MDGIRDAIHGAYLAGQLEWPDLRPVEYANFEQHVLKLGTSAVDLERNGAEIYLALACTGCDPEALRILRARYFPALDEYLQRNGFNSATREDVFQQALLHLCTGASPRILTYAGRATLASWLHVAIHRFAMNLGDPPALAGKRSRDLSVDDFLVSECDLEIRAAIEQARPLFQQALHKALASLAERERTLLRLCFVDGLSIDVIGTMYGVHRATAARWLNAIKRQIFERIQAELVQDCGLTPSEVRSLAFLVQSELQLSLKGLLGAA